MPVEIEIPPIPDGRRRLAGKVAIVTGGGSSGPLPGTGVAISTLFAVHGAQVAVLDISPDRAANTVELIDSAGGHGVPIVVDVTDVAECGRAVREVMEKFGRLDILANNAAITGGGRGAESYEDVWARVIALDLTAVMMLSRTAAPHMRAGGGGAIINVSSIAALRGMGGGPYAAAKAGVIGVTYDLAYRYGRDQIRVNCIAPGNIFTPMGDQGGSELREARRLSSLLGTEGNAWDVAWSALFLASEESRWITGVVLPVDAGTIRSTQLAMNMMDRVRLSEL
jgi:NAD(P)-dependent dehydrogenase (short-subunit alcohol dehydrogenase family)